MKIFECIKKPDWSDPKNYDLPEEIEEIIENMNHEEKELSSAWISFLLATYPRKKYPPMLIN